jgi:putative oxidoreductase
MSLPAGATAARAVFLIRLMVGGVFLAEGVQKFLYPAELGAGRFAKIGIPWPEISGPFVGGIEIVCGAAVLLGWMTRAAAAVLLIDISVAILSTKIPILLGRGLGPFSLPRLPRYGFWSFIHEARVDFSMWLGCLFLVLAGPGGISLDARLARRSRGS